MLVRDTAPTLPVAVSESAKVCEGRLDADAASDEDGSPEEVDELVAASDSRLLREGAALLEPILVEVEQVLASLDTVGAPEFESAR